LRVLHLRFRIFKHINIYRYTKRANNKYKDNNYEFHTKKNRV